jgi:ATP-dependent Zn protease
MSPNAQATSTAPKPREITCTHEAGHAVVAHLLYGAVKGVRLDSDGGVVWFGDRPPEDRSECEEAARTRFRDTEDLLHEVGPMPPWLVSQNFAKWRNNTIIVLAGPEAERLAFGLTLSPPNSDLLSAKMYTRRLSTSRQAANLLLDHCRAEARAILQMRWPAVEAISRALDRDDELDGEEVAKLIKRNPPLR